MFDPFLKIAIADIIDTVFVAILLYSAIVWAKRTRAALVVRGIFILGAIYIIARQLDLQLTAWILQGFFAIFLIIIVVIFQEELREIFERIAVWSLTPKAVPALHSEAVDVLVRTLADFARDRTGALIVVCGKNPIERHIMGGIELGGKLSEPLLRSIFDPHSPGHDGAVIVEGGHISRFAAHLPLSKNLQQLSQVGTRHSAALGLAELTDALCIVVSEERGKISDARDSRLREVSNLQELGALLDEFLQEKFPSQDRGKIPLQLLRENWVAKAVSLSLAIGFWYVFVPGSKMIEVTHKIPVKVENLSPHLQLEGIRPPEINATFIGPRRAFYLFDPKKLKITVDVSLADLGRRTFHVSEKNVLYPKDLTLQDLSPSTLKISVRKLPRRNEDNRR
ncbi:MAG: diadenylate cyclase [Thermodesulfobacteriota bacterium]